MDLFRDQALLTQDGKYHNAESVLRGKDVILIYFSGIMKVPFSQKVDAYLCHQNFCQL